MTVLHEYRVQGWARESPASNVRRPMKEMKIRATTPLMAQQTYARCHQMPKKYWDDGTTKPLIVICVERVSLFQTNAPKLEREFDKSHVYNTILAFSICEDAKARIDDMNNALDAIGMGSGKFIIPDSDNWYGGTKRLERPLFVAAFNYLDLESLLLRMKDIPWQVQDEVQLLVAGQDDEPNLYTERFRTGE